MGLEAAESVAPLGLQDRVLTQLHTFGKALASSVDACCVPLYTSQ